MITRTVSTLGFGALLLIGLLAAITVVTGTHAEVRHGFEDAQMIRSCVQNEANILEVWHDPCTQRQQIICKPDARYAIMIVEAVENTLREVTCYFKEKMPELRQVENYLKNRGSVRLR